MTPRVPLLIAFGVVLALPAAAQEKPEPPGREVRVGRDTAAAQPAAGLPKIDLPEYEITGDEVIDLPGFAKTAVEGGTAIDPLAGRTQGAREAVTDIGIGGPRARPGTEEGKRGKATASYGSFVTPSLQAAYGRTFEGYDVLLKGGYRSSEGHAANRDFREASASAAVSATAGPDGFPWGVDRLRASLGLEGDGYRLYGSAVPGRERTVERFLLETAATGGTDLLRTFDAALSVGGTSVVDTFQAYETEVGLAAGAEADLEGWTVDADAGFWIDFYRPASEVGNPLLFTLRPVAEKYIAEDWRLTAGFGFHLLRGTTGPVVGRIWPAVEISWYPSDPLRVFAAYDPTVERVNLGVLVRANPYLRNDEQIRHTEYPVAVRTGVEFTPARGWTLTAAGTYREARGLPVPLDPAGTGVWSFAYDGTTRITGAEVELYADVSDDDQLAANAEFRSLELSTTGKKPPYYPSVTAGASYMKRFPFGLSAGTRLQFVGTQEVDAANTATLPSYLLWSIEAEYRVLPPLGVTFGLTNILNARAERYRGYESRPRSVALGVAYRW